MTNNIYNGLAICKSAHTKKFAVLIDPDMINTSKLDQTISNAINSKVDYFFVGGSLIIDDYLNSCLEIIKKSTDIPVILFPGNPLQINDKADAIFFLSVISGRNPELLIGQHVITAPVLRNSGLEVIPTGYMIIDGGATTTVTYMSNTNPIPGNKDDIAICTAMAGEMLGLKLLYMDAGSGAQKPISVSMISAVSRNVNIPIIVGGGILTPEKAEENCRAGADVIVVGNAIEKDPIVTNEIAHAIHSVEMIH